MLGDEKKVHAVLENHLTAPISEAERALFTFIHMVNLSAAKIRQEDVNALKAVGWSDEAIYDAINVCALFNFYNRWIDANGVGHHSAELYAYSGVRLAQDGYADPGARMEKTG